MPRKLLFGLASTFLFIGAVGISAQDQDKTLDAVKEYLKKTYPNKKWQTGPTRLTSDAIEKAYGDQKFYYVFSAPPLPPGAPLPEAIKAYQAKLKEHMDNYISVTLRIDGKGRMTALAKPADYNEGLMEVKSDDDAKLAAAAVLALFGADRVPPGEVKPAEVKLAKNGQSWQATVDRRNQFIGTVEFDKNGKVTKLGKTFTGPVPP